MGKLKLFAIILSLTGMSLATELSSKNLAVNGHEIHYYQSGTQGSPVILLTGYATTSNFWPRDFIDCLASSHQVYLIDYRGVNSSESIVASELTIKSMADDTNAVVVKLKLKNPILIGWSMGGGVAQEASKTYSYRQLYLLASILPTSQPLIYPFKPHGEFKSESDILNYVFANNLYGYESSQLNSERKRFINPALKSLFPSATVITAEAHAIEAWQHESANVIGFENSKTPVQFWLAKHDGIINSQLAESIIGSYPNKTIHKVDLSGHAMAWQAGLDICNDISSNKALIKY